MSETIGAAQVELGVDDSGVDAGVKRAKKTIDSLGDSARKAGKDGAEGLGGIGKEADKLDASTKRTIASIERQTMAMGKSKSEYYAARAAIAGNSAALAPYIAKMGEAERATERLAERQQMLVQAKMAVGFVVTAVAAAVAASVTGAINSADALNDMSQRLGIGVKELAKYTLAAEQSGTSMEAVAAGVKGLAGNMATHDAALKAAGITARDADGAMRQLADVFARMPDGMEKTNLAVKLFGKSGMDLIPMLNLGSKGLSEAAEKSERYAAALAAAAPLADKFNDNMAELSMNGQMFGMTLANATLPGLIAISGAMSEAAKEGNLLNVALVAVGGVMSQMFTDHDMTRAQQIAKELERLRGLMDDNVKYGTGFGLFSMGDQTKQEVNNISAKMLRLQQELADIQSAEKKAQDDAKPKTPDLSGVKEWLAEYKKLMGALGGGQDEYAKAVKASDDYIAALAKETDAIGKNVYERKYLDVAAKMQTAATQAQRDAMMKNFVAWSAATQAEEANTKAKKDNEEAAKKAVKISEEAVKSQQDYMAGIGKETESLIEKAAAAEQENARIGLTAAQLAKLTVNRYDEQIAIKMAEAATLKAMGGREAEVFMIEQQIDALQRLAGAAAARPALEASAEAVKKQGEDWKSFAGDIRSSLTDALMRGFKDGENFGENFFGTLEAVAGTTVLKFGVELLTNPIMGGIQSVAQGGSFMSGASGLANIGNAFTTGGALTSAAGGYGAFAGSSMGSALGLSEMAVIPGSGGMAAGSALTPLGTAMPYIAAAVMAYSLLKGNGGTPTQSLGHANVGYDAAGNQTSYQSQYGVSNAATDATVAGMQSSYAQTAKSLGIGTVATQFGFAANTGENSQGHNFGLSGGAVGGPQFVQGETAYSDAAMGEAASRAVFAALQGSDLPEYLAGVFDGLDASKMSGQDISNTLAFAGALKQVRDGLTSTATPISVAQDALDAIGSTAASFTTDFVAAIDVGMTPERLAQWQAAGAALGNLGDMSLTMSAAVPQLTQSTWEMWIAQTNSVRGLISTFDGSVAATHALSAANRERYATEQQLVDQISGAMSTLPAMFAGSAEQMRLSVMSTQEKSNYFVDQANSLEAQLMSATDPAKIEELARKYNDAANNAWANLDETQRAANLDQYTSNLDEINAITTEKLGKSLDEIITTSGTDLPALIATAVGDAMTAFLIAQQVVANAFQGAADTMQGAANTPVQLDVNVGFVANVSGDSQVSVVQP